MTPTEKIEFIYNFLQGQEIYIYPGNKDEYIRCKRYLIEVKRELSK